MDGSLFPTIEAWRLQGDDNFQVGLGIESSMVSWLQKPLWWLAYGLVGVT
jgi:hypothetical protein